VTRWDWKSSDVVICVWYSGCRKTNDCHLALCSYGPFGAGLYPVWIASCSIMYLPLLVVP
jgi:hypothetical protein